MIPLTDDDHGLRFWIGLAVGWYMIGFGIHSAFHTAGASQPGYSLKLLIGFALLNDLFVVPVVIAIGLGLRRVLRGGIITRTALGALIISAIVSLQAWPALGKYGREPSLASSLLTNNMVTGLFTLLGVVWGVAAVIAVLRILHARRGAPAATKPTPASKPAELPHH